MDRITADLQGRAYPVSSPKHRSPSASVPASSGTLACLHDAVVGRTARHPGPFGLTLPRLDLKGRVTVDRGGGPESFQPRAICSAPSQFMEAGHGRRTCY